MVNNPSIWNSSNTRIVIDSSSNIPASIQSQYQMLEVPTIVNFGADSFRTNIDLTPDVFYERLVNDEHPPTTSQPPPKFFADAYRRAFAEGAEHIIVVTISKALSGTFASAQTAAREFGSLELETKAGQEPEADGERFLFWDGDSISLGSGYQAIVAARLLKKGIERDHLAEQLDQIRASMIGFATLDTLKYAPRSGRISNLQANIGNLLQVKIILDIQHGQISPVGRVRGRKRSLREIVDRQVAHFGSRLLNVGVLHANAMDDAEKVAIMAQQQLGVKELIISDIGSAIASFGGPGAIGIAGYPASFG
jgi:DegV family protein with EDD domain